jgi:hypothetical protein
MTYRTLMLSLCLTALTLSVGCGGPSRRAVYPAKGKLVAADGKPAVGATIILHPVKGTAEDIPHKPAATVNSEGSFVLTAYKDSDGAPAGEYVATIEWRPLPKTPFEPEQPDKLNGKFRDPSASPFKVTIEPKDNDLAMKLP